MIVNVVGKGKMGQAVSQELSQMGILGQVFDSLNPVSLSKIIDSKSEIVIDCSLGHIFLKNLPIYLEAKQKVVVVATGWYDQMDLVIKLVETAKGTLFWADNYSISMMIYKEVLKLSCQMLQQNPEFDIYGLELHHIAKKDAPAGTTQQIAKLIIENFPAKSEVLYDLPDGQIPPNILNIACLRGGTDNIIHDFYFDSPDELIEIKHSAKSRMAFVRGILKALKLVEVKSEGIFTLKDLVRL